MDRYRYKWWALVGLGLLSMTAFLDFTIVSTAIPFIQSALRASVIQLQWVVNIFIMIMSMFMVASGRLGEMYGNRRVFYSGFLLFAIAALGAGFSQNITMLIVFRAVQGFAAAIIFTVSVSIIPEAFPKEQQTKAIGVYGGFTGAGLAIGPFLSGVLITLLSWRWVFWINLPIIALGLICCSFSLKRSPKSETPIKMDWPGLVLLVIGLGLFVYGIIYGEQVGWGQWVTWVCMIIGVVSLVALYFVESKMKQPLLDFSLFNIHLASLATLTCVAAGLVADVLFFYDPIYLRVARNYDAFYIGLILFSVPIVQLIFSFVLTPMIKWFGLSRLLFAGVAVTIITTVFHLFFNATISIWFIIVGLMTMGYSWGIANAGSIVAINESVPTNKIGVSIGTVFTVWNVAGAIGLAIATVLFHAQETSYMQSALSRLGVTLNGEQQHAVKMMLLDPDNVKGSVMQHLGTKLHEVMYLFKLSFLHGYHWAVGIILIMGGLATACAWKLRR